MSAARAYPMHGLNGSTSYRWKEPQCPVAIVRSGDRVQLSWYGDSGVPMWLNQGWATVVKLNRRRIVVNPDKAARGLWSVLPERHVIAVRHVNSKEA